MKPSEIWKEVKPRIGEMLVAVNDIETRAEKAQEEAYQRGYETAKHECEDCPKQTYNDTLRMDVYQKGLSDAWETVKELFSFTFDEKATIFKTTSVRDIVRKYSASETIEKIDAYEQEKEEQIQVGDEVIRHYKNEFMEGDDAPSIFLSEEDGHFRCLAFNGRSIMIAEYPKNQYRKTGRHFPEIAEVLQKMKES